MNKRLLIRNLNYETTEETLRKKFSAYGEVTEVTIIRNKGFGFVEFANEAEAQKARNALKGTSLDGRPIRVDEAREQAKERKVGDSQASKEIKPARKVKLVLNNSQTNSLEDYFRRYKSAVDWFLERIEEADKHPNNDYAIAVEKPKRGPCSICGRSEKRSRSSPHRKEAITLRWQVKEGDRNGPKVCTAKCVLVYLAEKWYPEGYPRSFGLERTELLSAYDIAKSLLTARKRSLTAKRNDLDEVKQEIEWWTEVRDDATIIRVVDGQEQEVHARCPVAGQENRYTHWDLRDKDFNGIEILNGDISRIETKLADLERQREQLTKEVKNMEESVIEARKPKVKLDRKQLIDLSIEPGNCWFNIKLSGDEVHLPAELPDASQRKLSAGRRRQYQQLTEALKWLKEEHKKAQNPEFFIVKSGSNFGLQFPHTRAIPPVQAKELGSAIPVGLDLGEGTHYFAAWDRKRGKPCFGRAFDTSTLKRLRSIAVEKGKNLRKRIDYEARKIAKDICNHILLLRQKLGRYPIVLGIEKTKFMAPEQEVPNTWFRPKEGAKYADAAVAVTERLVKAHTMLAGFSEIIMDALTKAFPLAWDKKEKKGLSRNIKKQAEWFKTRIGASILYEKLREFLKGKLPSEAARTLAENPLWNALKHSIDAQQTALKRQANRDLHVRKAFRHFVRILRWKLLTLTDEQGLPVPVKIEEIPAGWTSQSCYRCGAKPPQAFRAVNPAKKGAQPVKGAQPKERRGGKRFYCKKCKSEVDADFNAAVNIAKKAYEQAEQALAQKK